MNTRTMDELGAAMYGTPATPAPTPQATTAPQGPAPVARPRTEAELGAAMYGPGGSMQAAQPLANADTVDTSEPQTHEPRSQEQIADALYAPEDLPEAEAPTDPEMLALRDSPERRMYGGCDHLQQSIGDLCQTSTQKFGRLCCVCAALAPSR